MLSGCASFSELQSADAKIATAWHAALPHDGHVSNLESWWSTFNDPSLTALIGHAEAENPSLDSSIADIEKARATLASARASLFPSLSGSGSVSGSGTSGDTVNRIEAGTTSSGGLDASWEIDLFGKNRQKSEAARQRIGEEVADWHDARVSLAAEVADDYVQYRACRQIENAYSVELASQRDTIRATETAASSGLTSTSDLALARASAASSSSTLTEQRAECEVLVKSLAELTGGDEIRVRQLLAKGKNDIPTPKNLRIAAVPAAALRQRPDIGALEQEVAATVADVGAAKADLYPSLSLSGSLTVSGSTATGASLPWSFGPSLTIPLLDGGSRSAAVESAIADYNKAVAKYKSGVLSAISDIETDLVRVDSTRKRIGDAATAASNYRTYFNSIDTNWKAGGASLLDREEARRSAQSAEITLIEVRRDAVRYWIALYKALGGGWDLKPSAPAPEKTKAQGTLL
ncbi:efflux transporter outer membrane subunit [Methylovirgula sp. 4M-Z18]|nr:efflux transporter outer membrane subunit [Methylovirgula sp. 4M-Z18]